MKHLQASPKRVICSNPDSVFRYFGWPTVARLEDGTLAMAASGFRLKHICPFGKGVLCYSRDDGQSWTQPAVIMDTPLDDRDSGIVPFGKNCAIFTSFNNSLDNQRDWLRTLSGEHEWNPLHRDLAAAYLPAADALGTEKAFLGSTYRISEDGGYTFGPVQRVPVTAPHGPCSLLDGSLLYVGTRFEQSRNAHGKEKYLQAWKLNDMDQWELVGEIENVHVDGHLMLSCEPHAIQLPDGKIVVHIRVQSYERGVFTLYQCESMDGGQTFTQPYPLLGRKGGAPAFLLRHSSGVLVSVYGYREAPYGIRAMFSYDGGKTWDTDWILDDTAAVPDLGYPAAVELQDGSLLTVYYENIGEQSPIMQQIWTLPKKQG